MRAFLSTAALAILAFTATATAAETTDAVAAGNSGWELRPFNVYDRDDDDKPEAERRVKYSGVIVHTTDASQPGALLTCSEKFGLSVMYSLKPVDFADQEYFGSSNQVRTFDGRLNVEGDVPAKQSRFLVRRKLGVAQPVNADDAFKTVDALYAGKALNVDVPGFDPVDIKLPSPDKSFKEFVASCPEFVQP